ncbi:Uma2 family endonuclease [Paraclostridium bifermentans]|uniref:Uma2 family endonuclease n=1 Tax=Paraclostridium bifermentans TaxID=1490 RepID=UPI00189D4520|nr:Uma2 family endonuclease [Paraclostridium bifermentans]MBQ5695297.1 Uma2 family endonuclease [Clostridium sp.]
MGVDIKEDFLQKEEWINNIKFMSPRPRYNHIELQGEIYMQLKQYFKKRCNVSIEAALFLTKDDPIEIKNDKNKIDLLVKSKKAEVAPDVAVYCDKNQIFYRGYIGIPQLVVEVLSPSNADDDLIVKKDLYEKYGVPEYWIISPMSKKVWIYMLIDNKYELKNSCTLNDKFTSTRFEELEIDLSEVELIVEE